MEHKLPVKFRKLRRLVGACCSTGISYGCIRALHSSMSHRVSNAEIADKLFGLAYLLATRKENPFKIKAYRRAAGTIRALGESVAELVHSNADLTRYSGIGPAISDVVREIVKTGSTRRIQELQSQITPELAGVLDFPLLDPKRVLRIYKKLKISTIGELRERLENGEIGRVLGPGMDQHVRRALSDHREMLLHEADRTVAVVQEFLIERCRVTRAEAAGDYRRRVDVIQELHFLVETSNFPEVVETLKTYGGNGEILESSRRLRPVQGFCRTLESHGRTREPLGPGSSRSDRIPAPSAQT